MKINKLKLVNYRCHENKEIDFTDGINLLLGNNGSGKSSVLEAIGFALFDSSNKRTSGSNDAVMQGKTTAEIYLEFISNDHQEYVIERKIGGSKSYKLYKKGEKPTKQSNAEIAEIVKQLTGIVGSNSEKIYQSVITCYQNQITSVFLGTAGDRDTFFNKIFDTEIYDLIEKRFGEVEKNYQAQQRDSETKINTLQSGVGDIDELETSKTELNSALEIATQKAVELAKNKEELTKELDRIKEIRNNMQIITNDLNNSNDNKVKVEKQLAETSDELEKANTAQKTLEENELSYREYMQIDERNKVVSEQILELEKHEKLLKQKKDKHSELGKELATNSAKIQNYFENKTRLENEIEITENEKTNTNEIINSISENINSTQAEYDALANHNSYLNSINEKLKIVSSRRYFTTNQIKSIEIKSDDYFENQINDFNNELIEIAKVIDNKSQLNDQMNQEKAKLSELKSAKKKLSGGLCPYLKEACKNLAAEGDSDMYFNEREAFLNSEIDNLKHQIIELGEPESQRDEVNSSVATVKEKQAENEKNKSKLTQLQIELSKDDEITSSHKKLANQYVEINLPLFINQLDSDNYDAIIIDVTTNLQKISNTISEHKATQKSHSEKLVSLETKANGLIKDLESNSKAINKLEKLINSINEELLVIMTDCEELTEKIEPLANLKATQQKISEDLDKLKPLFLLYVSNEEKAKEIPHHISKISELELNIEKMSKIIEEYSHKMNELQSLLENVDQVHLQTDLNSVEEESKANLNKITELKIDVSRVIDEIERYKSTQSKIAKTKSLLSLLNKKLTLATAFRNEMKGMGSKVAHGYLENISLLATENYRRISGKTDSIVWSSEKEKYLVSIVSDSNPEGRRFEILSGGEQVSVALSLRAAMTNFLSKAQFAIFDEPTVNLDSTRRVALAESLNEMLKGNKQALIVTHDDTFREMAQKVIEF